MLRYVTLILAGIAFSFLVLATSAFAAPREKVLYSFSDNGNDGYWPQSGLVLDVAGNLYGTTLSGGAHGYGTVFQLAPSVGDSWTETVLYSFCSASGCTDGAAPTAGLTLDATGNLYGTTSSGGVNDCSGYGCGVVFELSPGMNGQWQEKILHSFNGTDGESPNAVVFDHVGTLYGTTYTGGGGKCSCGTVFSLSSDAGGRWTEKILHNFDYDGKDGVEPLAGVVLDAVGSVYGTTYWGGAHGWGVVFEVSRKANGKWEERILHSFNGTENATSAGVILDALGNLYGTTYGDGTHRYGSVFELSPSTNGKWILETLHSFNGNNGCCLVAGLVLDATGNLYGTTRFGGPNQCPPFTCGVVFELSPGPTGRWAERVLHNFDDSGTDGTIPEASLIFDASGNLYGTTFQGGRYEYGTVFEITP